MVHVSEVNNIVTPYRTGYKGMGFGHQDYEQKAKMLFSPSHQSLHMVKMVHHQSSL